MTPPDDPKAAPRARRRSAPTPKPDATGPEAPRPDAPLAAEAPEAAAPARPPVVLGPDPGPILAGDMMAAAGLKAMWVQLNRLLARAEALGDPERPDDLRKYRVATRRLRAALRMFASAYPPKVVKPLRRGLSELADAVGSVRDLDHRIASLDRWAAEQGDGSPARVAPLVDAWATERKRRLAELMRRVATRRHRRLIGDLAKFVQRESLAAAGPQEGPQLIRDRVASRVWAAYEEVRAFADVLHGADLETLHRVRISVKRLRDNLEFLADVVGPTRAPLVDRLVALQDHLGALNDAAVTTAAVREFLEAHHGTLDPDQQSAITAYAADREREIAHLMRSVDGPWRPVVAIAFARRLGRLIIIPVATP